LHPDKVFIKTLYSGLDFLGWVHFTGYRVLRTSTKKKMLRNLNTGNAMSYGGLLSHGNTYKISENIKFKLAVMGFDGEY